LSRYERCGSERHRKSGRLYPTTLRGRIAPKTVQNATKVTILGTLVYVKLALFHSRIQEPTHA
jgi:hypothetical protein